MTASKAKTNSTNTDETVEEVKKEMFSIVDKPVETRRGRKPLYNPFMGNLPGEGKAGTFSVKANSTEARRSIRQIRAAAHAEGKSARIMESDPVKGQVTITFWTVDRVTRNKVETVETDETEDAKS